MKHLFVPYELALKLKEKGFNEDCIGYYKNIPFKSYPEIVFIWEDDMHPVSNSHIGKWWGLCSAPLYQQVIDFVNSKGFSLKYGNIPLPLLNKQIEECLNKLESIE